MMIGKKTETVVNSGAVCGFNQTGYCKFGKHCFKKHVDIICENVRCSTSGCNLRHPRTCRYFSQYRYCKFGQYCKFSHEERRTSHSTAEIDILMLDIEKLKKEICEKDKDIKEKDSEISQLLDLNKTPSEREKELDIQIDYLKNVNKNLKLENHELKEKIKATNEENEELINDRAVTDMLHQSFKERMRDKYLYNTEDEESDESDDNIERKEEKYLEKENQMQEGKSMFVKYVISRQKIGQD